MLPKLIMLAVDHQNKFIHLDKAEIQIAVQPSWNVKKPWNWKLQMLEQPYQLSEFTWEWQKNPKYGDDWPLFTTQH